MRSAARLLLCLATAACATRAAGPPERAPASQHPGTVVIYERGADFSYNERIFAPLNDADEKLLVFLPLVVYDEPGGAPQPGIAASWEASADERRWTFRVRPDLRWHDGVPVTAEDVRLTFELVGRFVGPSIGRVEVIDGDRFTIEYPTPSRRALNGWDIVLPAHIVSRLDPAELPRWEFWTRPQGSGPYRYVRHVPDSMTVLEAWEGAPRGRPAIRRVILKYFGEDALTEVLTGRVDIARLDHAEALRLRSLTGHGYRVYPMITPLRMQIAWNVRRPLLQDAAVRRALVQAIDRGRLHREVYGVDALPLHDGICTSRQYRRATCGEPLPYDPRRARAALESLGWRLGADGVLERAGEPFRLELLAADDERSAAEYVAAQLREVGIAVNVSILSNSELRRRARSGEFDAVLDELVNSVAAFRRVLGPGNSAGYENVGVTVALDSAAQAGGPERVDEWLARASRILASEVPLVFLAPKVRHTAVHERVRGLDPPFESNAILNLHRLWIEAR